MLWIKVTDNVLYVIKLISFHFKENVDIQRKLCIIETLTNFIERLKMELTVTITKSGTTTSYNKKQLQIGLDYIKGLLEQGIAFTVTFA